MTELFKSLVNITVTQLLAEAGGGTSTSTERKVRVLREGANRQLEVIEVNIPRIRQSLDQDVLLKERDIVTVGRSAYKLAFKGFFD